MMQVDSKLSRCISIKIPIMKKKAMHLPILSLQTDSKVRKRVKKNQEIKIATDRKEKRSVSQLLNIEQKPEPMSHIFLKRLEEKKKKRELRESGRHSVQQILRYKKPQKLLQAFQDQFESALQRLIKIKKQVPKITSLKSYIYKQSLQRKKNKDAAEDSNRFYRSLQSENLTANRIKLFPLNSNQKGSSLEHLESSLLKRDRRQKGTFKKAYHFRLNRGKSQNSNQGQQLLKEGDQNVSGWPQKRYRYKSWEADEVPDYFFCQYYQF